MGYTKIAGTPVITGLYTILIPMTLFAVFGSSRHLVVGADSATAAILAGTLATMTASGWLSGWQMASVLALLSAGFLIIAVILRLEFLADFLSRTVLTGFLTGVGVQGTSARSWKVYSRSTRRISSAWPYREPHCRRRRLKEGSLQNPATPRARGWGSGNARAATNFRRNAAAGTRRHGGARSRSGEARALWRNLENKEKL